MYPASATKMSLLQVTKHVGIKFTTKDILIEEIMLSSL